GTARRGGGGGGIKGGERPVGNRPLSAQAQVGLREDLPCCLELALELLDQGEARALAPRTAACAAGEPLRLAHRLLRPLRDLVGEPVECPQRLAATHARRRD